MAVQQGANSSGSVKLDKRLVLQDYMFNLLGFSDFEDVAEILRARPEFEEIDADGHTGFLAILAAALPHGAVLTRQELTQYDENIVAHTRYIGRKRGKALRWKYFQYVALLFTEMFLDRFMRHPGGLLSALNEQLESFNVRLPEGDRLPEFEAADLRKVAFWMATGSGKTLIMHANILQYHHYQRLHRDGQGVNRVILLTPKAGLSNQHLSELHASGFTRAELFRPDTQTMLPLTEDVPVVEIIHIHRLKEKAGQTTVAIEAFEGNNLVLVDEGHLGASGEDWMDKRDRLCSEGFSFEYSATFGQAMNSPSARKKGLDARYAKAILLDYAYRRFHHDGYGKDYSILNLASDQDLKVRQLYLTASVLSFYEQQKVFSDHQEELRPYNLEKPLWIVVGQSVSAVRSENQRRVSDVVDMLLFLADFIGDRSAAVGRIQRLLSGAPGLLDPQGNEVFAESFSFLRESGWTAEQVYDNLLAHVFHSNGPGSLHVEYLKGSDGELLLRLGDNEPFGLINVGDASALRKLCEEQMNDLVVTEQEFSQSHFEGISSSHSPINVLIGSRKFIEGWSSWRVSTMGIMNLGKGEGSLIIQLFGRGVRLQGHGGMLKRSSAIPSIRPPGYLKLLETLNVFGVRADYMHQFKQYLEEEGIPTGGERFEFVMPVVKNLGSTRLRYPRLRPTANFKREGPKPTLGMPTEAIQRHRIVMDWYPRIQMQTSLQQPQSESLRGDAKTFESDHLAFIDWDRVYSELQAYKRERGYHNLQIERSQLEALLQDTTWSELYLPEQDMTIGEFRDVDRLQDLATALLKRYVDRYYLHAKDAWEREHGLELVELDESDPNFIEEYRIQVEASRSDIIACLEKLQAHIAAGDFKDVHFGEILHGIQFQQHLYQPLIHVHDAGIDVSPVALNRGERTFIGHLRTIYEDERDIFGDAELYVLRNQSRGRGVAFFEAGNYYPDFIVWLVTGEHQHIGFIDPKGIRHLNGEEDPKIRFYRTVKELESHFNDPHLAMDAFIFSVTRHQDVQFFGGGMSKEDFSKHHVFFQEDGRNAVKSIIEVLASSIE